MQFLFRQARLLSNALIQVGLPIRETAVFLGLPFLFLVARRRLDRWCLVAVAATTTAAAATATAGTLASRLVAGLRSRWRRRGRRRRRRRRTFLRSPTDVQSNTGRHLNINHSADSNVEVIVVIVALAVVMVVPVHVMTVVRRYGSRHRFSESFILLSNVFPLFLLFKCDSCTYWQ